MAALHVVTGAFGYSGSYIAERLLAAGVEVRTLTNSPNRSGRLAGQVDVQPLAFNDHEALAGSLRGAAVLYNTYWVRYNHRTFTHSQAVENSRRLFAAATEAGVGRVVHVSITNPSADSPFEYFRGKAELEDCLRDSGMPHTILRPAVLFGGEDILINNIAWALRHLPVFGLFGDGRYRLQPIHVADFAALAATEGSASGDRTINAIGPETFTYRQLVAGISRAIGVRRLIVCLPPRLAYALGRMAGLILRDTIVTWDEVGGLMADLLCTASSPTGSIKLTEWARENAHSLGRHYASELARRRDRERPYRRETC